jgi:hypothetical protein
MKFMSAAPFKCSFFVNATVPTVNSEHIEPLKYCNNLGSYVPADSDEREKLMKPNQA